MAPEYVMHGSLSTKADVFSFGILLLEIISGKKISNFISEPDGQGLLEWAWILYKKNQSLEIMDPKLVSTAVTHQVRSCIQIGLLCTERDPRVRPTMQRVLVLLSKKPGTFEEPMRPGFLGSRNRDSTGGSSGTVIISPLFHLGFSFSFGFNRKDKHHNLYIHKPKAPPFSFEAACEKLARSNFFNSLVIDYVVVVVAFGSGAASYNVQANHGNIEIEIWMALFGECGSRQTGTIELNRQTTMSRDAWIKIMMGVQDCDLYRPHGQQTAKTVN
ncbi:hypothetical protein ACLOJK_025239 [Asimina triloba]